MAESDSSEGSEHSHTEYFASGTPRFEGTIKKGKYHGPSCKEYRKDNSIRYKGGFAFGKWDGQGEKYFRNGPPEYIGNFKGGNYHGQGCEYREDGSKRYEGAFIEGRWEGNGIKYFENGNIQFRAKFSNRNVSGQSCTEFRSDESLRYFGSFVDGRWEGHGIYYHLNGYHKYEGNFVNNILNGPGCIEHDQLGQKIYEGDMLMGKYTGTGTRFYPNGTPKFIGKLDCGRYITGEEFREDGTKRYEGPYNSERKFEGHGKFYFRSGKLKEEGNYVNGKLEGEDCQEHREEGGVCYKGGCKQGKRSGFGLTYYENEVERYKGMFVDDKCEDPNGIEYKEDRTVLYKGEFKKGNWEGKGVRYYEDGSILFEGEFVEGRRLKGIEYRRGGTIRYEGQYKDGNYGGQGKYYGREGQLKWEGNFIDGFIEGDKGKQYFHDGKIDYEGQFKSGKPEGFGKQYDKGGNVKRDGYFVEGRYYGQKPPKNVRKQMEANYALEEREMSTGKRENSSDEEDLKYPDQINYPQSPMVAAKNKKNSKNDIPKYVVVKEVKPIIGIEQKLNSDVYDAPLSNDTVMIDSNRKESQVMSNTQAPEIQKEEQDVRLPEEEGEKIDVLNTKVEESTRKIEDQGYIVQETMIDYQKNTQSTKDIEKVYGIINIDQQQSKRDIETLKVEIEAEIIQNSRRSIQLSEKDIFYAEAKAKAIQDMEKLQYIKEDMEESSRKVDMLQVEVQAEILQSKREIVEDNMSELQEVANNVFNGIEQKLLKNMSLVSGLAADVEKVATEKPKMVIGEMVNFNDPEIKAELLKVENLQQQLKESKENIDDLQVQIQAEIVQSRRSVLSVGLIGSDVKNGFNESGASNVYRQSKFHGNLENSRRLIDKLQIDLEVNKAEIKGGRVSLPVIPIQIETIKNFQNKRHSIPPNQQYHQAAPGDDIKAQRGEMNTLDQELKEFDDKIDNIETMIDSAKGEIDNIQLEVQVEIVKSNCVINSEIPRDENCLSNLQELQVKLEDQKLGIEHQESNLQASVMLSKRSVTQGGDCQNNILGDPSQAGSFKKIPPKLNQLRSSLMESKRTVEKLQIELKVELENIVFQELEKSKRGIELPKSFRQLHDSESDKIDNLLNLVDESKRNVQKLQQEVQSEVIMSKNVSDLPASKKEIKKLESLYKTLEESKKLSDKIQIEAQAEILQSRRSIAYKRSSCRNSNPSQRLINQLSTFNRQNSQPKLSSKRLIDSKINVEESNREMEKLQDIKLECEQNKRELNDLQVQIQLGLEQSRKSCIESISKMDMKVNSIRNSIDQSVHSSQKGIRQSHDEVVGIGLNDGTNELDAIRKGAKETGSMQTIKSMTPSMVDEYKNTGSKNLDASIKSSHSQNLNYRPVSGRGNQMTDRYSSHRSMQTILNQAGDMANEYQQYGLNNYSIDGRSEHSILGGGSMQQISSNKFVKSQYGVNIGRDGDISSTKKIVPIPEVNNAIIPEIPENFDNWGDSVKAKKKQLKWFGTINHDSTESEMIIQHLLIEFDGSILGNGEDIKGKYEITGKVENKNHVKMTKKYLHNSDYVNFDGTLGMSSYGGNITGDWYDNNHNNGTFLLALTVDKWYGRYTQFDTKHKMNLEVQADNDGVYGIGKDDSGCFIIKGDFDLKNRMMNFVKKYFEGHRVAYSGVVEEESDWGRMKVVGVWKAPKQNGVEVETEGGFNLKRMSDDDSDHYESPVGSQMSI